MELKDFITMSLIQIRDGIAGANEHLKKKLAKDENYYLMRPGRGSGERPSGIDFDVAISTRTEATKGGKAKAKIYIIEGGAGAKTGTTNEIVSRLKFHIELKNWVG